MIKNILSLVCILILLSGCCFMDSLICKEHTIVGTWSFRDSSMGPVVLKFNKDETYDLDTNGDGTKDIWGSYRVSQDVLLLNDTGGYFAKDCGVRAVYHFAIQDNEAHFTIFADQCMFRASALAVVWKRKNISSER